MSKYKGKSLIEILNFIMLMKDYNLTQLSEATGLELTFLSRFMNGYTNYKLTSLEPLADYLSTDKLPIDITVLVGLASNNTKICKTSNNYVQGALIRVFWVK